MKRWLTGVVGVLVLLALGGCDPYLAAAPGDVELQTSVGTDGSATVQVFFDDTAVRSATELRAAGQEVAARLFPSGAAGLAMPVVSVHVEGNGGGYPFVVLDARRLYRPGARPQVPFDTRDAVAWLLDHGARSVDVSVDAPRVPLGVTWSPAPSSDDDPASWTWRDVSSAAHAPAGVLTMTPRPWLGLLPVAGLVAALALLVASVVAARRRRRGPAVLLLLASLAGPAVQLWGAGPVQLENLGVAGWLPLAAVTAAMTATGLSVLLVPAVAVVVLGYALLAGAPRTTALPG